MTMRFKDRSITTLTYGDRDIEIDVLRLFGIADPYVHFFYDFNASGTQRISVVNDFSVEEPSDGDVEEFIFRGQMKLYKRTGVVDTE